MYCRKGGPRGVCPSRYLKRPARIPTGSPFGCGDCPCGFVLLLDASPRPTMRTSICLYSKTLLNCFPGNCRMMPFISRSKSVARNFGRIQAGAFHNIINVHRLLGAEQFVELFLRAIQCGGGPIDSAVRPQAARLAGGRHGWAWAALRSRRRRRWRASRPA